MMYHYVRPPEAPFPQLKSRSLQDFRGQLDYLQMRHNMVTMEDVLAAIDGHQTLPQQAALLTFDDGYSDHYRYVFPELLTRKITGAFYVPACTIRERKLLSVNKIHLLLATLSDVSAIVGTIDRAVDDAHGRGQPDVQTAQAYRHEYMKASRLDTAEVIYVKRMLQHALPEAFREEILDQLLRRFVTSDERALADEFYASAANLAEMRSAGMHIGGHGDRHLWLNRCSVEECAQEVAASRALLKSLGVKEAELTFCYPYGGFTADTIECVKREGFRAAVTTEVAIAGLATANRFRLPRLDTIDLPVAA